MSDYPRMLYRRGKEARPHGFDCDTLIVDSVDEEAAAAAKGWFQSPALAHEAEQEDREERLEAEIERLEASIAKFDGDGDGKPGGRRRRKEVTDGNRL